MASPSRFEHVDIDRDRVPDDDVEIESVEGELPDRLDLPADVPEADAIEQRETVPLDDDYR